MQRILRGGQRFTFLVPVRQRGKDESGMEEMEGTLKLVTKVSEASQDAISPRHAA